MTVTKIVLVHRGGHVYRRRQPIHHKINKDILKREMRRLEEQREVIDENMRRAKRRVQKAIA